MSLLEKKRSTFKLDDTVPLSCHIEGREKKDSYVVSGNVTICIVGAADAANVQICLQRSLTVCLLSQLC